MNTWWEVFPRVNKMEAVVVAALLVQSAILRTALCMLLALLDNLVQSTFLSGTVAPRLYY